MSDFFLIFWALPSLIISLLLIDVCRRYEDDKPQSWGSFEWAGLATLSILYPLAVYVLLRPYVGPFLVKERQWFWEQD